MTQTLQYYADRAGVHFGTSGVRGLVADLMPEVCYAYTQAFLQTLAPQAARVMIGVDLRPSSPAIAAACAQAIREADRQMVFAGALPTPALAYAALRQQLPALMVTGSHIPFDRNGIKFYRVDGEISKADEAAMLGAPVAVPGALAPAPLPVVDTRALDAYAARYLSWFGTGALASMRVAVYEHSSVARDVLRTVLQQLGAEVIALGRTETFVPIDTEAVRAEDVAQAHAWAKAHRFDAILSTDGDADRPLLGDENGQWLRGDVVGVLCAQALGAQVVVTPVSSNTVVEQCGAFTQVLRTRIGSPYVIDAMQTAAAQSAAGTVVVGYEANGGFLLGSEIRHGETGLGALPTRDALLPMLALLAAAARRGCPLSQLAASLPARYTSSDRLQDIAPAASGKLLAALSRDHALASACMAPDAGGLQAQDETDGLRLTFASGDIVHLRPSGNAPELRCYAEANTPARAAALCQNCLQCVAQLVSETGAAC